MKALIQKIFNPAFEQFNETQPKMAIELATAILMIEVSRADFDQDPAELQSIRQLLLQHLSLPEQEVDSLLANAHEEADQLVSLQHITRLMNEKMDQLAKVRVIELMWLVAFADGEKHHYEEHLLRQVADLLYVSHADFIQARHQAELTV
jgi:uncharacterized tellurite resistance protein B-like protein